MPWLAGAVLSERFNVGVGNNAFLKGINVFVAGVDEEVTQTGCNV